MPDKGAKCCCCYGCINNGSLIPQCTACAGLPATGTGASDGGIVPLRYQWDGSWISVIHDTNPPCCPAGLSTSEMLANSSISSCRWIQDFACSIAPLLFGRATLTLNADGTAAFQIQLPADIGTGTGSGLQPPLALWRSFGPWKCLCANWVYLDLDYARSHPPPIGCGLPLRICIQPLGDCCASSRPPNDQMPKTLTAVLFNEEQCRNLQGFEFSITWNPVSYQWEAFNIAVGADCIFDHVYMRCTNSQDGGCSSFEMDIRWTRPYVGTFDIINYPAAAPPVFNCSCYPFITKFAEILNGFPCCSGPVGTGTAFAPRLSVLVME